MGIPVRPRWRHPLDPGRPPPNPDTNNCSDDDHGDCDRPLFSGAGWSLRCNLAFGKNPENPDRPRNVLDLDLAQVFEFNIHPVADLIARGPGEADATGFRQAFQPGRDIDAVTKQVAILFDDIAEIYADAKLNAPIFWNRNCPGS